MSERQAQFDIQLLDRPVTYDAPPPSDRAECGAECAFLGRTRLESHPVHGDLKRLEYEAYRPLAEKMMRRLARQAASRFGCSFVRLHHALGEVPPTEASVFIQVMTGHRAEAFEACRFLIDELKARVPIWKREQWADGTTWSEGTPVMPESEVDSRSDHAAEDCRTLPSPGSTHT